VRITLLWAAAVAAAVDSLAPVVLTLLLAVAALAVSAPVLE
jgi:hypothetical protein